MRITITGATGMIGSDLIRCALDNNIEVTAIVRPNSSRSSNLPKTDDIDIVESDISGYDELEGLEETDVFYHLAWDKTFGSGRDDTYTQINNMKYTLDAVRLAKRIGAKKFVGAGSQAEYGPTDVPLNEETRIKPESGYGIAKYAGGRMAKLLCEQLGIEFNWARILSVYGIRDSERTLISYVINTLLKGETPGLTPCEQYWDYIYSKDAARALLDIGLKGVPGRTYALGSGQCRRLREYVEDIRDVIDKDAAIEFGAIDYYPHQPMYLNADISQLTADTGFTPKYDFKDGIREIVESKRL